MRKQEQERYIIIKYIYRYREIGQLTYYIEIVINNSHLILEIHLVNILYLVLRDGARHVWL